MLLRVELAMLAQSISTGVLKKMEGVHALSHTHLWNARIQVGSRFLFLQSCAEGLLFLSEHAPEYNDIGKLLAQITAMTAVNSGLDDL